MRNIFVIILVLLVLTSCAQVDHANLSAQQRTVFTRQIVAKINAKCPITDGRFRIDSANTVSYGDKVVVSATDLGMTYSDKINYEDYYSEAIAGEKNTYCSSSDFRYAREADIPFEYVYRDKYKRTLHEFTVSNYICKETITNERAADVPSVGSKSTKPTSNSKEKLVELKALYGEGIITQTEYEQKRQSILEEL